MNNKLSNLLLFICVITSSCSKNNEKDSSVSEMLNNQESLQEGLSYQNWNKLFESETFNFRLAEILVQSLSDHDRSKKRSQFINTDDLQLENSLRDIKRLEKEQREIFYFRNAFWAEKEFLAKTITTSETELINQYTNPSSQIKLVIAANAKKDILNNILKTYKSRIEVISSELAPNMANAILDENPLAAESIEQCILNKNQTSQRCTERISNIILALERVEHYFQGSGLNNSEQVIATLGAAGVGAVAYQVYHLVKEAKTFKQAVKLAKEIKNIHIKIKELQVLTQSVSEYLKIMNKDLNEFNHAFRSVAKDLDTGFKKIKEKGIRINADEKKAFKYLYDKTLTGRSMSKTDEKTVGGSFVTTAWEIDNNVSVMISSASNLTSNFNNILMTSQVMAKSLGIKLPNEVNDLIKAAGKANVVISAAKNVMQGLATGGVLGAFSAFTSGPGASLVNSAIPSFEDRVMGEFHGMNRKIDEVVALQKQTIDLQLKTMTMIKDLALLMDEHHLTVMSSLSELKDLNLIGLEMLKTELNKGISACEGMVVYELTKKRSINFSSIEPNLAAVNAQELLKQIGSLKGIQNYIKSTGAMKFESCQDGIGKAFSNNDFNENPVRAIFSTSDTENLKSFQDKKYRPLLHYFQKSSLKNFSLQMGLHVPMRRIKDLNKKYAYVYDFLGNTDDSFYTVYEMISPVSLERYTAQLLIQAPFLDLDKSDWEKDSRNLIKEYLEDHTAITPRSQFFLNNALALIQSAIAQEAILSGEPLLNQIHHDLENLFEVHTKYPCQKDDDLSKRVCAVGSNGFIMKNLFKYAFLFENKATGRNINDYKKAYFEKDLITLGSLIFNKKITNRLIIKDDEIKFKSISIPGKDNGENNILINLPSPEELQEGLVLYSDNMKRLLSLQDKVINAIVKNRFHDLPKESMEILQGQLLIL